MGTRFLALHKCLFPYKILFIQLNGKPQTRLEGVVFGVYIFAPGAVAFLEPQPIKRPASPCNHAVVLPRFP